MKFLRATIRLIALLIMTAGFWVLFRSTKSVIRSRRKGLAWRNWNVRNWCRLSLRLLNIRINIRNAPPRAPFLLVSNHLSYIDVIVLGSQVDCAFIAKSEVGRWPVVGGLGRLVDTVFIDRNSKRDVLNVMKQMQYLINSGLGVVLFAEGTSTSGQQVSRFKSSTLELAAQRQVPVHYASISYATRADEISAAQSVCWWGEMTFSDHFFRLLQLSGVEAQLIFGAEPIVDGDRHVLAAKLWQAVNAQFVPVRVARVES